MSESFYITDDEISDEVFDELEVPSEDTVSDRKNLRFKRKVNNIINGLWGFTENHPDQFGLLKEFGLLIYKRLIDDDKKPPVRDEDEYMIRKITVRYKKPPIAGIGGSQSNGIIHG